MNLEQSSDSEDEATENTRLMSDSVAMENRAYNADHGDSHSVGNRHSDSRRGDRSGLTDAVPSTETVGSMTFFLLYFVISCKL